LRLGTRDWVWACYRPLLLVREVPSPPATWLLPTRELNARLFDSGYQTAVLERRHGADAAGCAAYENRRRRLTGVRHRGACTREGRSTVARPPVSQVAGARRGPAPGGGGGGGSLLAMPVARLLFPA
jgi:hypothetical protein